MIIINNYPDKISPENYIYVINTSFFFKIVDTAGMTGKVPGIFPFVSEGEF